LELPKKGDGPETTLLQKVKNRAPEKFDEIKKELHELSNLIEIKDELKEYEKLIEDLKR